MSDLPSVSIVIPCRNEEAYLGKCLESILNNDYPSERLEVLVVDGESTDRSRKIAMDYAARYPFVRLLTNPERIAPVALNIGIRQAKGDVIMRMDAHSLYPHDYISKLIRRQMETGADNIGGVWLTLPGADTALAWAIAIGFAHPFGVGNAYFRIGVTSERWVDSVPFGCYRREVFDRIGLFDEELVRNQDDELNLRLLSRGGRILLVPDVVSSYFARTSLRSTWRMFYQYGYLKPLVARKVGKILTWRQLVPGAFVLSVIVTGLTALVLPVVSYLLYGILGTYLALVLLFAVRSALRGRTWAGCLVSLVFPVMHVSYGLGSLRGVVEFIILNRGRRRAIRELPLSR